MKNRKLDNIISLTPFVILALIPIGRFIFGKIIKKQEEQDKLNKEQSKEKKTD